MTDNSPFVHAFFHEDTWTVSYVVSDPHTNDAVVIDPVLDYDSLRSQTSTESAQEILEFIEREGLNLKAVLETHAHADHISAARFLSERFNVPVGIGAGITQVQETFASVYHFGDDVAVDGSQFEILFQPNDVVEFGGLSLKALATPGHTPACVSYLIGDAVFTGDALFMEDYGTGRTDFPAGSASDLYRSVTTELYALPESTRVFVGHDYQPGGREVRFESSIERQKASNVQLPATRSEADFVEFREQRDGGLRAPRLIYQSIQINVFGGQLPDAESNGGRYLKIPLNRVRPTDANGAPLDTQASAAE